MYATKRSSSSRVRQRRNLSRARTVRRSSSKEWRVDDRDQSRRGQVDDAVRVPLCDRSGDQHVRVDHDSVNVATRSSNAGSAPFSANRGERVTGRPVTAMRIGELIAHKVRPGDEALHRSGHDLGRIDAAPVGLAATS